MSIKNHIKKLHKNPVVRLIFLFYHVVAHDSMTICYFKFSLQPMFNVQKMLEILKENLKGMFLILIPL